MSTTDRIVHCVEPCAVLCAWGVVSAIRCRGVAFTPTHILGQNKRDLLVLNCLILVTRVSNPCVLSVTVLHPCVAINAQVCHVLVLWELLLNRRALLLIGSIGALAPGTALLVFLQLYMCPFVCSRSTTV